MQRLFAALLLASTAGGSALRPQEPSCTAACHTEAPIFIAFYWKARPG